MNIVLWIIQALLALLFLFAGGTKLVMSLDVLQKMAAEIHLTAMFLRFIGVVEVLGGLGLILPGLLKVKPGLIPIAAAGLLIIMIGAVALSIMGQGVAAGIFPLITGALCAFVAYGRTKLVPLKGRA
jgi:hypothetical protein